MNHFAVLSAAEIKAELARLKGYARIFPDKVIQWLSKANEADIDDVLNYIEQEQLLSQEWIPKLRGNPPDSSIEATWGDSRHHSEMIWIPPGPFLLGAKRTPHTSPGFYLASHPVTNRQFVSFVQATDYRPSDEHADKFLSHWEKSYRPGNRYPPRDLMDHPVTWVSYIDALHFCHWAGFDLPTQWLWEKAARGADGRRFPWGDTTPDRNSHLAHVFANSTTAVGAYAHIRSAYGCQEMVGNVSEWCHPGDAAHPGRLPQRPAIAACEAPIDLAPVRGACFMRRNPQRLVAWHPRNLAATRRNQWVGFRVAFYPIGSRSPA